MQEKSPEPQGENSTEPNGSVPEISAKSAGNGANNSREKENKGNTPEVKYMKGNDKTVDGKAEDSEEDKVQLHVSQSGRRPLLGKAPLSLLDATILDLTEAENRRLLPDGKNPLHVINGPEYRYFLGIIDFLTLYECRQRTGRVLKSIKFLCKDHSTIPPQAYGERFLDFIRERTTGTNDKKNEKTEIK